jgi:competence transcription factor ComK
MLVVYTKENSHPIWISNNNIRSVHPDVKNCRLTVKLFNGEDMVIDDVESYDLQAGNEMLDYDFQ